MNLTPWIDSELRPGLLVGVFAVLTLLIGLVLVTRPNSAGAGPSHSVEASAQNPPLAPLCQFGVNVLGDVAQFDTASLRMGWYLDYGASVAPAEPNGAEYAPVVMLAQVGASGYSSSPGGPQLQAAIASNPGAIWFIGNEPDRRIYQNDLEPHVYARAYHDLYQFIKTADPTSRIFAGTIVQPTPIRLQYLDMVLDSYRASYGEAMPVDGWSIHNFILNEVSCSYDPTNCWGAEVPPGINAPYGEILSIEDNDSMTLFIERIQRFRQWMADRGYRGLPVYLSEYGILMPQEYGFPPSRVNAFMSQTFDYMMTASDPLLGDPNDDYRLIQRWSWFSTSEASNFNGWLFDPVTYLISEMGANFRDYVANLPSEVDLYPSRIFADPAAPFSQGEPVTLTLKTVIANSGNMITRTEPVDVRFYDGDPTSGAVQIGPTHSVSLTGCGDNRVFEVTWSNVLPGTHQVYVTVDPALGESDVADNKASQTLLVATERVHLPVINR